MLAFPKRDKKEVGIRIDKSANDSAKIYKEWVHLTQGRDITVKEALEELIAAGVESKIPKMKSDIEKLKRGK